MSSTLFDFDFGASFSEDRKHRYALWRIWDASKPIVMFIGLNPSTANETESDNTIERVGAISQYNGFGGFYMMNCWTFITPYPKELQINPMVNNMNNDVLTVTASVCAAVVFAWGAFPIVKEMGRDKELMEMFPNAQALFINKDGSPKHPLYCKKDTKLIPFRY